MKASEKEQQAELKRLLALAVEQERPMLDGFIRKTEGEWFKAKKGETTSYVLPDNSLLVRIHHSGYLLHIQPEDWRYYDDDVFYCGE